VIKGGAIEVDVVLVCGRVDVVGESVVVVGAREVVAGETEVIAIDVDVVGVNVEIVVVADDVELVVSGTVLVTMIAISGIVDGVDVGVGSRLIKSRDEEVPLGQSFEDFQTTLRVNELEQSGNVEPLDLTVAETVRDGHVPTRAYRKDLSLATQTTFGTTMAIASLISEAPHAFALFKVRMTPDLEIQKRETGVACVEWRPNAVRQRKATANMTKRWMAPNVSRRWESRRVDEPVHIGRPAS
jgi:hypothetical protein